MGILWCSVERVHSRNFLCVRLVLRDIEHPFYKFILLPVWTGMLHFVRLSIAFAVIGLASTAAPISGGFAAFFLAIFEVGSSLVPLNTTEMLC
jgi:hypothetical protein